jgi:hypothetical protein
MVYIDQLAAYVSNRTPHPINLILPEGTVTIPNDGEPIRLPEQRLPGGNIVDTVQLLDIKLPEPKWLPAPSNSNCDGQEPFLPTAVPGHTITDASGRFEYAPVLFIVSMAMAQYAAQQGREDFVAPDTGSGAVRDTDGKIIGVRGFVRYSL